MGCVCSGGGFCERHGIHKTAQWRELCATRADYFEAWERGIGPGQRGTASSVKQGGSPVPLTFNGGPQAWRALHTYIQSSSWNPAEARRWYEEEWLPTIPSFGCRCRRHWHEIASASPPDFSSELAFFRWGVDRHNDVNRKLGRHDYAFEDAMQDRRERLDQKASLRTN